MVNNPKPCGTPGALIHKWRLSTVPKKSDGGQRARNKFAGNCEFCGRRVPAGDGCIEKDPQTGKWVVFC